MPLPSHSSFTALLRLRASLLLPHPLRHLLHTTPSLLSKPLPPRRVIPESEIIENFLKGSGPGGQKINKTSSAVQLKHIPTGIVVKYQDTRSRELNRKTARRLLQDRLEELELGDEARTRVKGREISKKKKSAAKKSRRKYRALEAGKEGEERVNCAEGLEELEGGVDKLEEVAEGQIEGAGNMADSKGRREGGDKAG